MKPRNALSWHGTTCFPIAALAAVLCSLTVTPTHAGKPGAVSPPVDTGTIYYRLYVYPDAPSPTLELWAMKPDGVAKTKVLASLPTYCVEPSQARHDSQRWFLFTGKVANEFYPDGRPRYELFVFNEAGETVRVTDDPSVQPLVVIDDGDAMPRWVNQAGPDTGVSYLGRRWGKDPSGADVIVDVGLFVADLDPATLGSGFVPVQPTRSPVPLPIREYPESDDYGLRAAAAGYDWSPDGTRLVYADPVPNGGGLYVADALTGSAEQLTPAGDGMDRVPRWSPVNADGQSRIAFKSGAGWNTAIYSISPTGSGRALVIPPTLPRGSLLGFSWSPAASHLAYDVLTENRTGVVSVHIFRATAEGDSPTDLTRKIDFVGILGWRAEP